jgi:hypothetical protein
MWGVSRLCFYINGLFFRFFPLPLSLPHATITMARLTPTSSTSKAYRVHAVTSMTKADLVELCNAKDKRYKTLKKERSK